MHTAGPPLVAVPVRWAACAWLVVRSPKVRLVGGAFNWAGATRGISGRIRDGLINGLVTAKCQGLVS